jgi:hypothetical protein
MRFVYLGDHAETRVFGLLFRAGEPTEVTDERAIAKLRNNADFAEDIDGTQVAPKRRGRPPKAK